MRIPLFDPTPRLRRRRGALRDAFARLLDGGTFVLGPAVASFEEELAAFLGGGQVVGVASGSDALELSLRALDVGPGQAVLTTPFTFVATAEAIHHVGATPVFVDVRDDDLLLDLDAVEEGLDALPCSPRGRPLLPSGQEVSVLLPVHLFGAVLPPDRLARLCERFRLRLVEDAAQALGGHHDARRAGTFGQAGCFSFFPSKTLGALGDGGAIWTDDLALAGRLRGLRQHGQPSKQQPSAEPGRNSRLDALQAAMLAVLLPHLDEEIGERRALIERYRRRLSGCPGLTLVGPEHLDGHAAQQAVVRCADRDGLAAHLQACGVGTAVYYRTPLHRLAPYRGCPALGPLVRAERAAREALALPLYPGLPEDAVDEVASRIAEYPSARL